MKKRLLILAKVSISVFLIGYLFSLIDLEVFVDQFTGINGAVLALAFVLLLTQSALSSYKWKLILKGDAVLLPYLFLLRTYLIGGFISLFLPTSVGGDIYRVAVVKGANQSLGKSLSSVLFDRLTGLFALVSIAMWSYLFFPGGKYAVALFSLYAMSIVVFLTALSRPVVTSSQGQRVALLGKIVSLLRSFSAYRQNTRLLMVVLGLAFVFQVNVILINKMYCIALEIDIPMTYLLVIIPLIYLTEMVPISINGLGLRESAFVFFFVQLGYAKEEGLAVALLVIFMRYLTGLVGGLLLLATIVNSRARKPVDGADSGAASPSSPRRARSKSP